MFVLNRDNFVGYNKGNLKMTFANGYTLSIVVGDGTYSDGNFNDGFTSAEVAAWDADGNWVKLSVGDDVIGWQSPDDVLALMNRVAAM